MGNARASLPEPEKAMGDAMDSWRRVEAAEKRGDIRRPQDGHYELTREAYQRIRDANTAQPRNL